MNRLQLLGATRRLLDTANLYSNPTTGRKNQHTEILPIQAMTSFGVLILFDPGPRMGKRLFGSRFVRDQRSVSDGGSFLMSDFLMSAHEAYLCDARLWPHDARLWPHDARLWPHDAHLWPRDASLWPHDASLCDHDAGGGTGANRSKAPPRTCNPTRFCVVWNSSRALTHVWWSRYRILRLALWP